MLIGETVTGTPVVDFWKSLFILRVPHWDCRHFSIFLFLRQATNPITVVLR
ncbi:hypothetical protein [Bradyrhizobium sp.]|uniref:hypothetical protein n=1 Tax=Bradyrhizobium sp. TaxID=376 RepID=UPI001D91AC31|nr:hypothetical protein [Bradyrhizobium sp.]MBV8701901.1 hypothetical protein [Bradyrhizobium sp.]MBV9980675.1 hypothetical protein [Bradyrhizobium sp.]